jgi:uncharacterized protein (TIGR03382 family)
MRHLWLLAALAMTGTASPAVVFAQTPGTMTAFDPDTKVTVGGQDIEPSQQYVYLGAAACEADVPITITLPTQTTGASPVMELWVGEANDDCTLGANRDTGDDEIATCREIDIGADGNNPGNTPKVSTTARKLFGKDNTETCADEGDRWAYVLLLQSGSDPMGNDNITDNTKYRKVGFRVDVTAPAAPTKVSTENGESVVEISWDLPDDLDTENEDGAKVRVYWDPMSITPASDMTCTSTLLMAGQDPPAANAGSQQSISRATSWSTSPSTLANLGLNQKIAVAVAAVDETGNVSKLSEVKCVAKVDTVGFCEENSGTAEAGDCGDDFDTCSASPWRGAGSLWSVLALGAGALLLSRRRRSTRDAATGRNV